MAGFGSVAGIGHKPPAPSEYDSAAAVSITQIDSSISFIRVAGFTQPGDGGHSLYRKVSSEPLHAGKIRSLDGAWWEIVVPANGLDVRALGVKADGITDDYDALLRADSVTGQLRFPPGRILLGRIMTPTRQPIRWRGAGKGAVKNRPFSDVLNATQLVGNHGGPAVLEFTGAAQATESLELHDMEIAGNPANPPGDQHGIVTRRRWHTARFERVSFSSLTGVGLAFDPGISGNPTYCQNASMEDISWYVCGGAIGLTHEPADEQNYLCCTQLAMANCNFDHGINTLSSRRAMFDFRAFRGLSLDTIVTEGAGAKGANEVFAFSTNAFSFMRNMHCEFTTDPPDYFIYVYGDPTKKFYGATEPNIYVEGYTGTARIGFQAGTEAVVHVKGWNYYSAASYPNLVEFGDHSGVLNIEDLQVKRPFGVPYGLAGQLNIKSVRSLDSSVPAVRRNLRKFVSWRPLQGSPARFQNPFASGSVSATSSALEADDIDARIYVFRATGVEGRMGPVTWNVHIPDDWMLDGVGPVITAVMRYRITVAEADLNEVGIYAPRVKGADVVSGGRFGFIDGSPMTPYNHWQTCVCAIRPRRTNFSITQDAVGRLSAPAVLRISAFDLYLGSDYDEPLELDHVPMAASLTLEPLRVAEGACWRKEIKIASAVPGDMANVSYSLPLKGLLIFAEVPTSETVLVTLFNPNADAVALGGGTLRVEVHPVKA